MYTAQQLGGLVIGLVLVLVLFIVLRSVFLWYYKITHIVKELKEQNTYLKYMCDRLHEMQKIMDKEVNKVGSNNGMKTTENIK